MSGLFPNLVSRHDVAAFFRLVRKKKLMSRLFLSRMNRVGAAWSCPIAQDWNSIPAIQARKNRMTTGDEALDFRRYTADRFLERGGLKMLSLGCGSGEKECAWVNTGLFAGVEACDLSDTRLDQARAHARGQGLEGTIRFFKADALALEGQGVYDMVVCEHSLHHLAPMTRAADRIHRLLKPGGLLVCDEFIGPSRFQWSDTQMGLINELLRHLPARFRTRTDGSVKTLEHVPGRLTMRLYDPSEAADSSAMVAALQARFSGEVFAGYGGTLLHLVFKDIAHHFLTPEPEAAAFLSRCLGTEDRFMAEGKLGHDFAYMVFRKS